MADRRYNPLLGLLGLGDAGDIASGIGRSASKALFPFANAPDPAIEGQRAALRGDVPPPAPPPPPANDPGFAPPHPTRREMVTRDPVTEGQKRGILGESYTRMNRVTPGPPEPRRNLDALRRNQEQSFIRPLMQTSGEPMSAADMENRKGAMDALDSFYGTEDELRGDHQADTFQNEQFETALAEQDQKQSLADTLALDPFAREKAVADSQLELYRGQRGYDRQIEQDRVEDVRTKFEALDRDMQNRLGVLRMSPEWQAADERQRKEYEDSIKAQIEAKKQSLGLGNAFGMRLGQAIKPFSEGGGF